MRRYLVAIVSALALVMGSILVARGGSSFPPPSGGFINGGARLELTSNQSCANNAATAISWQAGSAIYDTNAFYSFGTQPTRLTIPTGYAGKYLVTAQIAFDVDASGVRGVRIQRYNAADALQQTNEALYQSVTVGGLGPSLSTSGIFSCADGDYFKISGVVNAAGGAVNALATSTTNFCIARVGN